MRSLVVSLIEARGGEMNLRDLADLGLAEIVDAMKADGRVKVIGCQLGGYTMKLVRLA